MKRFMKIYKKVIMIFALCFTMGITLFFTDRNVMTAYAYTEEEKAAAKAWLSQNGYPPTMDGAQQAYQDYLNGKFGQVDGNETPGESVPQTPDETDNETGEKTPPASQEGDSAAEAKTEEKGENSDNEAKTEEKAGDTGSETNEVTQKSDSDTATNEVTQKSNSANETNKVTQKDGSGSRTKTEEKEGSSDSKTKVASQKEKSDLGTKSVENKQTGNKSTEIESDNLLASDDGKSENQEGSDIGIGAENSEGLSINNEIYAGDLNTAEQSKTNIILIIVVIGAVVLIYFIRRYYIKNKREKYQSQ